MTLQDQNEKVANLGTMTLSRAVRSCKGGVEVGLSSRILASKLKIGGSILRIGASG